METELPSLFDTHCHLDQSEFDSDRDDAIDRAVAAGVRTILAVGVTADTSRACVELAARRREVYAAVGLQPNYCGQAQPGDWDCVVELAKQPRVIALGETGLDRYWDCTPWNVQQDYFDRHLRLSQQTGLPFIVHSRECDDEIVAMLREAAQRAALRGVMHSFTGTAATMAECVELGLYISFAGMLTYKKSQALRDVARLVPEDRLLIETDSPYLSPHPLRGKRNEPAHLVHTAACLAEVRGISREDLCQRTYENAAKLFVLPERGAYASVPPDAPAETKR